MSEIDWNRYDEHQYPESTVECRCGASFRSHAKAVMQAGAPMVFVSRKSCPNCGKTIDIRSVRSDPDSLDIG